MNKKSFAAEPRETGRRAVSNLRKAVTMKTVVEDCERCNTNWGFHDNFADSLHSFTACSYSHMSIYLQVPSLPPSFPTSFPALPPSFKCLSFLAIHSKAIGFFNSVDPNPLQLDRILVTLQRLNPLFSGVDNNSLATRNRSLIIFLPHFWSTRKYPKKRKRKV